MVTTSGWDEDSFPGSSTSAAFRFLVTEDGGGFMLIVLVGVLRVDVRRFGRCGGSEENEDDDVRSSSCCHNTRTLDRETHSKTPLCVHRTSISSSSSSS